MIHHHLFINELLDPTTKCIILSKNAKSNEEKKISNNFIHALQNIDEDQYDENQ